MAKRLKKSYKFAFRSSLFIVLTLTLFLGLYMHYAATIEWLFLVCFAMVSFGVSFLIIQHRVERFIYRRIKKIYDDVSLLESTSFSSAPITTDIKTLTEEIEKLLKAKKLKLILLRLEKSTEKIFLVMYLTSLKLHYLPYKVIF